MRKENWKQTILEKRKNNFFEKVLAKFLEKIKERGREYW